MGGGRGAVACACACALLALLEGRGVFRQIKNPRKRRSRAVSATALTIQATAKYRQTIHHQAHLHQTRRQGRRIFAPRVLSKIQEFPTQGISSVKRMSDEHELITKVVYRYPRCKVNPCKNSHRVVGATLMVLTLLARTGNAAAAAAAAAEDNEGDDDDDGDDVDDNGDVMMRTRTRTVGTIRDSFFMLIATCEDEVYDGDIWENWPMLTMSSIGLKRLRE